MTQDKTKLTAFTLKLSDDDRQTMKLVCAVDSAFKYQYQMFDAAVYWAIENKEKLVWVCEDTPLRKKLYEVEKFIDVLNVDEVERVRILKLSKGEGELERHTDIQDRDAGLNDGQWARLHFPLQTNKNVIFTQWNTDGTETTTRMRLNELWYLDMRKPHTAVNFGEEDRYHLVIDVRSNERLRHWLRKSLRKYPPIKQVADYED